MVNLNLSEDQTQMLIETLESTVADLGYEIGNTAVFDYRQKLKEKRDELNGILENLRAASRHNPE